PPAASPPPRNMFPPPTTTATSLPSHTASATASATYWAISGSIPSPPPPANASPESFSITRFHPELCMAGSVLVASFTACGLPCRPRAAQGPRVLLHRASTPRCAKRPVFTEGALEISPRHLPHFSIP